MVVPKPPKCEAATSKAMEFFKFSIVLKKKEYYLWLNRVDSNDAYANQESS